MRRDLCALQVIASCFFLKAPSSLPAVMLAFGVRSNAYTRDAQQNAPPQQAQGRSNMRQQSRFSPAPAFHMPLLLAHWSLSLSPSAPLPRQPRPRRLARPRVACVHARTRMHAPALRKRRECAAATPLRHTVLALRVANPDIEQAQAFGGKNLTRYRTRRIGGPVIVIVCQPKQPMLLQLHFLLS